MNNPLQGRPRERKGANTVQKMTKEELAKTLLKKKECNRKALEIVEMMLNDCVEEDWLIKNLLNIRQNHFQDITEERSILKLCGYPLCRRHLENVPSHKYHISAKLNKVYDTTERKKFCSNVCYKAAVHLEKQLLTSPLWFTEISENPNFTLIPITHAPKNSEGIIGDEIMFFPDSSLVDDVLPEQKSKVENFISINQIAEESLVKIRLEASAKGQREQKGNSVTSTNVDSGSISSYSKVPPPEDSTVLWQSTRQSNQEDSCDTASCPPEKPTNQLDASVNPPNECTGCTNEEISHHDASPKITEPSPKGSNQQETQKASTLLPENSSMGVKKRVSKQAVGSVSAATACKTSYIEKCISEWCTLETLILLLGESKVKEMFKERGKPRAQLEEVLDHRLSDSRYQEQYEKITKRLQLIDIEDMQYDGQLRGTPADDLKPLPSYTDLQDVSRKLELKVNAFYEGKTSYVDSGPITEPEDAAEENLMPLVDNQAQKTLRRKIVLDQLNRVLPNILRVCGFTCAEVSRELRSLVNTFSLSANNISFKPVEWNLVGLVALNMLAFKDSTLKSRLRTPQAQRFQMTLLKGFSADNGFIEELLHSRLLDVDTIWNKIVKET